MSNIYKSSNGIFADFANRIKPQNSNWRGDAGQWINSALSDVGNAANRIERTVSTTANNYRFKLPSDAKSIIGFRYKGEKLFAHQKNGSDWYRYDNSQPMYVQTSFQTGEVIITYLILNVDSNGMPMIPVLSGNELENYLFFYILRNWLMTNTHPVFTYQYVDEKIEGPSGRRDLGFKFAARNALKALSPDDMEALKDSTVGLFTDDNRFETPSNVTILDDSSYNIIP